MCKYLTRCGEFADMQTCLAANLQNELPANWFSQGAVANGLVLYDGSLVAQCFNAIAGRSCDPTSQDGRELFTRPCYEAQLGTLGNGAGCEMDVECISSQCSASCVNMCCKGTCIGDTPTEWDILVGQPCSTGIGERCVAGAYCSAAVCTPLSTAGTTCQLSRECDYGLSCEQTTMSTTCVALPTLGEPCTQSCRSVGTTCKQLTCMPVGLPGDSCSQELDCSQYYTCDQTTSKCVLGAGIGDACPLTKCYLDQTFCDSGTCVALHPDGTPCVLGSECLGNACDPTTKLCATPACY
jgi:hypothetical protein